MAGSSSSETNSVELPETNLVELPLPDFGFAFNDINFSDRVMWIEVVPDLPRFEPNPDDNNRKHRCDCPLSNANANGDELLIKVKAIHVSSPILAAKSSFFYKLFSNGMMESEKRHATLRIHVSEEAAVMDLLNFMYSNTLPRTTVAALLDVLIAADKFEAASCTTYCSRLLSSMPMTLESALLYLDLPSTVSMVDTVQKLIDAARQLLAASFKDLSKCEEEVVKLPLAGLEAVLSSDTLQVDSEDVVYDIVLKWARLNYPRLEERREFLSKRIVDLVRFPCMSHGKLKKALTCGDLDPELASKVVVEALFSKAEGVVAKRPYRLAAVKVVELETPWSECVVYLNVKREECAKLFPFGEIHSCAFRSGGQAFSLSATCQSYQNNLSRLSHGFGVLLSGTQEDASAVFTVDYVFSVRVRSSGDFQIISKGKRSVKEGEKAFHVLKIPWETFMADDSAYFIDDVLHVRAQLMINKEHKHTPAPVVNVYTLNQFHDLYYPLNPPRG